MQPEPLLWMGLPGAGAPRSWVGQYSSGNPVIRSDRSGYADVNDIGVVIESNGQFGESVDGTPEALAKFAAGSGYGFVDDVVGFVSSVGQLAYDGFSDPKGVAERVTGNGSWVLQHPGQIAAGMANAWNNGDAFDRGRMVGPIFIEAALGAGAARVGRASKAPLAKVFQGHGPGQGFTGVFDAGTGRISLRPSTAEAVIPEGWVARAGGHGAVSAEIGGDAASHAGSPPFWRKAAA